MRLAYRAILALYPAKYKAVFAQEMIETFEHAARDCRARGFGVFVAFALAEFAGILTGLVRERAAQQASGSGYLSQQCLAPAAAANLSSASTRDSPSEAAQLEERLRHLIRHMEFAIAHHDFPEARFYWE